MRGSTHTLKGSFGSDVSVTLNVTFDLHSKGKRMCASHSSHVKTGAFD